MQVLLILLLAVPARGDRRRLPRREPRAARAAGQPRRDAARRRVRARVGSQLSIERPRRGDDKTFRPEFVPAQRRQSACDELEADRLQHRPRVESEGRPKLGACSSTSASTA